MPRPPPTVRQFSAGSSSAAANRPRCKGTEGDDGEGILRVDFAEPDDKLEPIAWEEFFKTFEDRRLAFLYQDKTSDGKQSRFFKFVRRDG